MSLFSKSAAAALAIVMFSGTVAAIPYASKIRVSETTFNPTTGMTISYLLNETADAVTVDILDGTNVVATFAGSTAQGVNQVIWNGRADNASGTLVPAGTYRVRIDADKVSTAWTDVASQRSLGNFGPTTLYNQVFAGFSLNDFLFATDTDSNDFGVGLGFSVYTTPKHAAAIQFNADTSIRNGGDGYADRVFITTAVEEKATVGSYDMWGAAVDPDDPNIFYQTGQSGIAGHRLMRGNLASSATLVTADPLDLMTGFSPRSVVVAREGIAKYAYFANGFTILKAPMNPATNELTGPPIVITTFAVADRYSRFVTVDELGNLYYTSRQTGTGTTGIGGILLRWDAATVAGPTPVLTEANASWSVTYPSTMLHMMTVAITPQGNVYADLARGTEAGIYSIGSVTTPAIVKTLSVGDRVVNYTATGNPPISWARSTLASGLRSDPVGNLLSFDRGMEQIRLYAPPITSSEVITAPPSQTFVIQGSSVDAWTLY